MNNKYSSCLSTQEIESILKKAGIQATAQRIAICQYVLCEALHTTVEEIKEWADRNFPKISLATVYNTVNILVEAGLVKPLKLPHIEKIIYDNNVENHYHFLDENTGEIFDIEPEQLEFKYMLNKNFKINGIDILIRGVKA